MRTSRLAIGLILVASVVRIALAASIPLFPDETYYWDWSRNLAAGYFDHPPAIALLIRAGTTLLGTTALGVRLGAILAGAVASLAIVVTSWRLGSDATSPTSTNAPAVLDDPGVRAALLMLLIPGALVGFVLATPDAPLLAAIALTLAALERAIACPPRSTATLGWWAAAGVALGIAFCSKYTSVLVPFGVFVALLSRRDLRVRLAEPGPYVAAVIALVILTPTLMWNAAHGWISFAFQLHHGLGHTHGSALGRELTMIAGQLGLISPIVAVLAAVAVASALRNMSDPRRFLLAVTATTILAFFAVSALRRPVEANWPIPALVAALPLLATTRLTVSGRRWLIAGMALGAVCILVVAAQATTRLIRVSPRRDPISKAFGWSGLARSVQNAESLAHGCSAVWIAADRYQDASELAYNMPDTPRVFSLNLGGRPNQYDLWTSLYSVASPTDCALVVVDEGHEGETVVQQIGADSSSRLGDAVMRWDGSVVGRRTIWLVRGIPSAPPVEVELSAMASSALSAAAASYPVHAALLDSIVRAFNLGPVPNNVTTTSESPVVSTDQRARIITRVGSLHELLQHAGFEAVYRDARYSDCTFVRSSETDATDIGYVHAPVGCRLARGHGDGLLRIQHAGGAWYAYASPERGRP